MPRKGNGARLVFFGPKRKVGRPRKIAADVQQPIVKAEKIKKDVKKKKVEKRAKKEKVEKRMTSEKRAKKEKAEKRTSVIIDLSSDESDDRDDPFLDLFGDIPILADENATLRRTIVENDEAHKHVVASLNKDKYLILSKYNEVLEENASLKSMIANDRNRHYKSVQKLKGECDEMKTKYEEALKKIGKDEATTCSICLDNKSNVIFVSCGHVCACVDCKNALPDVKRQQKRCPYCKTVTKTDKAYIV